MKTLKLYKDFYILPDGEIVGVIQTELVKGDWFMFAEKVCFHGGKLNINTYMKVIFSTVKREGIDLLVLPSEAEEAWKSLYSKWLTKNSGVLTSEDKFKFIEGYQANTKEFTMLQMKEAIYQTTIEAIAGNNLDNTTKKIIQSLTPQLQSFDVETETRGHIRTFDKRVKRTTQEIKSTNGVINAVNLKYK